MDLDSNLAGGYRGVTVNVAMADNSGNIGYQLLAPVPIRKDTTPFLGLRVLDGRTTAYDWVDDGVQTVALSALPRSLNPSKGYVATANNKQTSANAQNDYGAALWPTPRGERISEMIEAKIAAGEKLTWRDMRDIQHDSVDTHGRRTVPLKIAMVESVKADYSEEEQGDLNDMIELLTGWDGEMGLESVAASVYQVHQGALARTMFGAWDEISEDRRCSLFTGQYRGFTFEAVARMLRLALEGDYSYNPLCKVPGKEYKSENICAYNVADALLATKKKLSDDISEDPNDWKWGDLVVTRFDNTPWSYVPQLRPYIDKYIVIPGNANTNNIAEFSICGWGDPPQQPHPKFIAGKTAAYTHICTFEPEFRTEGNRYGIPGGLNESPLGPNFDDMIEQHL